MNINELILEGQSFKDKFQNDETSYQPYINENDELSYRTWIRKCILYFERNKLNDSIVVKVIKKFETDTDYTNSEDYYKNMIATLQAIQPDEIERISAQQRLLDTIDWANS